MLGHVLDAFSPRTYLAQRRHYEHELERARGERPAGAPQPKDSVLAELSGWYERWSLLAIQLFREQHEVALALGLNPGRAPLRLRNKRTVTLPTVA